jgi:ParB-like chromosome segregation protein Spo0J
MSQDIRRELISKNLGIKPINHGQVYTFQIALPNSRKQPLSLEQRQAIEQSLLAHQSNLISLIVRRTDAYDDEDIEYELVYGADWLQIAQELDLEKVWAWVFDMTDEQAIAAIAEMESLLEAPKNTQPSTKVPNSIDSDIATLIDQKLQLATDSIRNSMTPILNGIRSDLDEKLKILNYRIDNFSSTSSALNDLKAILEKLGAIEKKLEEISGKESTEKINLLKVSEQVIEVALKQLGVQDKRIQAAIKAVRFWKQSDQGLTWNNLQVSVKASSNSPYKIKGFAEGTFKQLQMVAYISEQDDME